MQDILVIGTGLVGRKLIKKIQEKENLHCYGTYYTTEKDLDCEQYWLDIRQRQKTFTLIKRINPDLVIDTAALSNVDECEEKPLKSQEINVEGTKNVAEACKKHNVSLIYLSSDYVFSGEASKKKYREEDKPTPVNVYGKHKLQAENIVLDILNDAIVARPSVIYGWNPVKKNFVTWMLDELTQGNEVSIVDDQYNNPTFADDLATILLELYLSDASSIYHTVGSKCLNRYEFALQIAEVFNYDDSLIKRIPSSGLKQKAERPKHCCLSIEKTKNALGRPPLSPAEGLRKMKRQSSQY